MTDARLAWTRALMVAAALACLQPHFAQADEPLPGAALTSHVRAELERATAEARKRDPMLFARVAQIRGILHHRPPSQHTQVRPVGRWLKALGPGALYPLLEELALRPRDTALDDRDWTFWRVGVLEAVGALRDRRSEDVLVAVVETETRVFEVKRAAAEALGKLRTDRVAQRLISYSHQFGQMRDAALAGMGNCRRLLIARELAALLSSRPAPTVANTIVKSLGEVGTAWAWRARTVYSDEEVPTRDLVAEALMAAYASYDGDVRAAIERALLVVDAPTTLSLIAEARARAVGEVAARLDHLRDRVARNPAR